MSLEEDVQTLIDEGVAKGKREHEAIRANVKDDEKGTPSPEYGWVEEIARFSDLAEFRGWIEGIRDALLAVARAIDEQASSHGRKT